MKACGFLIITLMISTVTWAKGNPDAGRLMRLVCYGVSEPGNLQSRTDLAIIIQQYNSELYDASYFVPGNDNFTDVIGTQESGFSVKVYENARGLSQQADPQQFAFELLHHQPNHTYATTGNRGDQGTFGVEWEAGSTVQYYPGLQEYNVYFNNVDSGSGFVYCDEPFSIEDPNAVVEPVQPQGGQSAELVEDAEEAAAEI